MYYQNYEDYMRQVLGYPINDPSIYETYDDRNNLGYEDTYSFRNQAISNTVTNMSEEEIRACYPEIYGLVYPMVCKVCESNTQPITRELIEKMTDEVYNAIEDSTTTVNIRVNTPKVEENRSNNSEKYSSQAKKPEVRTERTPIRGENNQRTLIREENKNNQRTPIREESKNNQRASIREEIKDNQRTNDKQEKDNPKVSSTETRQSNYILRDLITILLLQRLFGNRPQNPRPPRPPYPPRPGRPPFPGGRPPMIQPRDYTDYLEF